MINVARLQARRAVWVGWSLLMLAGAGPAGAVFERPPELAPAVTFWKRIYAELDTAAGLLHDNRYPAAVYRVLYLNPGAPPSAQEPIIERAIADLRATLRALAEGQDPPVSEDVARARALWGEEGAALRAAAERVRFQRGQADRFRRGLERAREWEERVAAILRARNLPVELGVLPHVESSYNPKALSKAGAAGLWQLMPATARRYLRVDEELDERFDVLKSTEAAALLLQQNYAVLPHWPLAITAYNHGLSGMLRAVRETGSTSLPTIIARYAGERFGFASRNFYAAFLAALEISSAPELYFTAPETPVVTLTAPAFLPAQPLAAAWGTSIAQLRALNPDIHYAVWNGTQLIPRGQRLHLPGAEPAEQARARLAHVAERFGFDAQLPYREYDVHPGESLSAIALRHGTSVAELMALNGLTDANTLSAGTVLTLPLGPVPQPASAEAAALLPHLLAASERARRPLLVASTAPVPSAVHSSGPSPCPEPLVGEALDAALAAAPADPQPDLAADPADYAVRADGSVQIQIAETLGHYAHWLETKTERLRALNGLNDNDGLVVGRWLKLDFSRVSPARFEQRRIAFHRTRQLRYFRNYRIVGVTEHRIAEGQSLWTLAITRYRVPLWLLRQYNPDIGLEARLPLDSLVRVPVVEPRPAASDCAV